MNIEQLLDNKELNWIKYLVESCKHDELEQMQKTNAKEIVELTEKQKTCIGNYESIKIDLESILLDVDGDINKRVEDFELITKQLELEKISYSTIQKRIKDLERKQAILKNAIDDVKYY